MKYREFFIELICLILGILFFYSGFLKLSHLHSFEFWIRKAPLLKEWVIFFKFFIPLVEVVIALLFLFPKMRSFALQASIGAMFLLMGYIILVKQLNYFVYPPVNGVLGKVSWRTEVFYLIGLLWLSFICMSLDKKKIKDLVTTLPAK